MRGAVMKVWTAPFLLAAVFTFSTSAPTTTDPTLEEVKQAASIDFIFIKNDLEDLKKSYSDSLAKGYLNSVGKLSVAANETYIKGMPKNTTGYNSLCLEGIFDDVVYRMGDLNTAVAVCANISFPGQRVDENTDQFRIIINSLEEFSMNLTNLIDTCIVKCPKPSWDRLQCVFGQVDVVADKFKPVYNQFKTYNAEMNGHLMLLQVQMSKCYEDALQQMSDISKAIQTDLEYCKT